MSPLTEVQKQNMGQLLRQLRRTAHISQGAVAALSDCSIATLRKVERGALGPSFHTVRVYAAFSGLGVNALMDQMGVEGPRTRAEILAYCAGLPANDPQSELLRQALNIPDDEAESLARWLLWLGRAVIGQQGTSFSPVM